MSLVTGNNSIDSLVYSSWADNPGTPVSLSYSFLTRPPSDASADDRNGFRPMTADQQAAAVAALAQWADVANITFHQVSSGGDIQLGTNDQGNESSGYAYLPDGRGSISLYVNNVDHYNSVFTPGSYGPTVLLHELGHTLGLKHPGNYDSVGSATATGPFLPSSTDNGDYTVMSYNVPSGYAANHQYNITPMLYDIQAMQYLYGANMSYHTGNDNYVFTDSAPPQCIWDAGGSDTLDFSACTSATTINLNAGTFSSTVEGYNNISIAYNVTIEGAITGNGGSTVICNSAGDTIVGGQGADVITEGAGSDHINGGGGDNTVIFGGSLAHYLISNTAQGLTVTGDGSDVLTNIEYLQFADGTVNVARLPQTTSVSIANQEVHFGHAFNLVLDEAHLFTVPEGTSLSLGAELADGANLPSWLSFDSQTGVFSGTPTVNDIGSLVVRVSASTGGFGSVSDDFKLVIASDGTLVQGTDGPDSLTPGPGDETINGGGGVDTVHYAGAEANYSVVANAGGVTVTDFVGNGGVDTLVNVERIQFADGALAIDTGGAAGELYRLYGAMFNRTPDAAGVGFWLNALDHGATPLMVAQSFINSAEFISLYGQNASDSVFVTSLYNNVLHRAPDAAGADFWINALANGGTRPALLVGFADSTENIGDVAALMPVGIPYIPYHA